MPESILDALPRPDAVEPALATLSAPVTLPVVDVSSLAAEIGTRAPVGGDPLAGTLPDLSGAPSAAGFLRALDEPLRAATAVNGPALIQSARGALPAQAPTPTFDVQSVVRDITAPVLPAGTGVPAPSSIPLPAALGDFSGPLRRLAEAGSATPLRLLQVSLAVLQKLVDTATDVERIKGYTAEALGEILVAQTGILRDRLPLASLEQARAALDSGYLDRIERLLADLDRLKAATGGELPYTLEAARDGALPALRHARAATGTLGALRAGRTAPLAEALDGVTGFATGGEVFLQGTFDAAEARVAAVLDAIAAPVRRLAEMIDDIRAYLQNAGEWADRAARDVAEQLDATLATVSASLATAREQIGAIAEQVRRFIGQVDVAPAIAEFKRGASELARGVDGLFVRVEEARQKLDTAVTGIAGTLDTRFHTGLARLEQEIRAGLDGITGVLDRQDVKQVLDQARQGVDRLKEVIDQASLQVVFDAVIRGTGELEGRVRAIDTARLGTPQKMALKVGVMVIREVDVDGVVRPELEAVFADVLEPLRQLVALLRERVLVVEERIDAFSPGTLLATRIDPHLRPLFDQLDRFRPSDALAPVRDALAALQTALEQLDPQRLADRLQDAYGQLRGVVDALKPTTLNAAVASAASTAIRQITTLRNVHLEDLLRTVRDNVSLSRLLEGTGVQEIADAELWERLGALLGGEYLDRITGAVDQVQTRLRAEAAGLDYAGPAAAVAAVRREVDAQRTVTAAGYRAAVDGLIASLEAAAERTAALEQRRTELLASGTGLPPEADDVLRQMALAPLTELLAALRAVAAVDNATLAADLARVREVLTTAALTGLGEMTEGRIREAAPDLFRVQVGDPVRAFVTRMKNRLQPFADAVGAIQDFVRTVLEELPAQVDAAVGTVLDAARDDLHAAATDIIATVETVRGEITATVDAAYRQVVEQVEALNPAFVLSSFGAADLDAGQLEALAQRVARPGQDEAAAQLYARLGQEELGLVTARKGGYGAALLGALNGALRDEGFARTLLHGARDRLEAERRAREAEVKTATGPALATARKALLRARALARRLDEAERAALAPASRTEGTIRLNRVLLEVSFPDQLPMGVSGLHPYVVALVGDLYPAASMAGLDAFYAETVATLREQPQRLIAGPLDDAYGRVKDKLHETFDIRGLFRVLDIKLEGMEGDLSRGLDRLSLAYDRLLETLDQRLSA